MPVHFSRRAAELRASEVRELLKLAGRPDVISFGAGLPPSECLPVAELAIAAGRVFAARGVEALAPGGTSARRGLSTRGRLLPERRDEETFRLAFSDSPPARITEGVRRLECAFHEVGSGMSRSVEARALV
jgi:DNA-binding transcriptional MocR family regulator